VIAGHGVVAVDGVDIRISNGVLFSGAGEPRAVLVDVVPEVDADRVMSIRRRCYVGDEVGSGHRSTASRCPIVGRLDIPRP
jgi:hypothetical protein